MSQESPGVQRALTDEQHRVLAAAAPPAPPALRSILTSDQNAALARQITAEWRL
jgi:hypothetical protein